jgi:hypothetical protein
MAKECRRQYHTACIPHYIGMGLTFRQDEENEQASDKQIGNNSETCVETESLCVCGRIQR